MVKGETQRNSHLATQSVNQPESRSPRPGHRFRYTYIQNRADQTLLNSSLSFKGLRVDVTCIEWNETLR